MAGTPFLSIGQFGGEGGGPWDDGTYQTIRQMIVHHGDVVDSIRIEYDNNGESKWSTLHGGNGGKSDEVKLDYPNEFLTSISGHYSIYGGNRVVRSLIIQSNKKQYGPYGVEVGDYFSTSSNGGKIVGFFGRSGGYLDSIAAHFVADDLISIGPFGGPNGNEFNDGTYTTIKRIVVRHGDGFVSLQIVYDQNGEERWSSQHGIISGGVISEVILDYPNEFLTSISGYLTQDSTNAIVQSLIFTSNKKQYGPYGNAQGKFFSTTSAGGKIIGFYGKSDAYINAIGAYFEPLSEPAEPFANA